MLWELKKIWYRIYQKVFKVAMQAVFLNCRSS